MSTTALETILREFHREKLAIRERHVAVDESLLRPAEVDVLCGDAARARERLGWRAKVALPELMAMMVDADLARIARRAE